VSNTIDSRGRTARIGHASLSAKKRESTVKKAAFPKRLLVLGGSRHQGRPANGAGLRRQILNKIGHFGEQEKRMKAALSGYQDALGTPLNAY